MLIWSLSDPAQTNKQDNFICEQIEGEITFHHKEHMETSDYISMKVKTPGTK